MFRPNRSSSGPLRKQIQEMFSLSALWDPKCSHVSVTEAKVYNIYLLIAIVLSPGGSGYFTCIQNTKSVTNKFKSGELHEKHVVATWNVGNHLSICL